MFAVNYGFSEKELVIVNRYHIIELACIVISSLF